MTIGRFERWLVWLSTGGTLGTGVVYWWMKEWLEPVDAWAVINHPLQPWILKAHILVAPVLVFAVGLITTRHVWRHYRQGVRKGRRSGLTATVTFVGLVVSGYVLQVVTGESVLRILGWAHLGLGVIYSAGLALHWPMTRNRTPAAERPPAIHGTEAGPAVFGLGRLPGHERRRRRGSGAGAR